MARSAVANKIVTPTVSSNALETNGIKVSVSTLRQDSQRPADATLPMCGPPPFFLEEAEVRMANTAVVMQSLKARVTCHNVMAIDNSIQKGTPTANIFKNESVSEGWYQSWLSWMIAKGIRKSSSGTVLHDVTQEAWCTSSSLEASYSLYASELAKSGIARYNTSYDDTVEGSEEIIFTHLLYLICYNDIRFHLIQKGTRTNTNAERTMC